MPYSSALTTPTCTPPGGSTRTSGSLSDRDPRRARHLITTLFTARAAHICIELARMGKEPSHAEPGTSWPTSITPHTSNGPTEAINGC